MRNINSVLRKNRRILEELIGGEETVKVNRERLLQMGFQFNHFTHTFSNRKRQTYFFCYEFGYLPMDTDTYLLVREKEQPLNNN